MMSELGNVNNSNLENDKSRFRDALNKKKVTRIVKEDHSGASKDSRKSSGGKTVRIFRRKSGGSS